MKALLARLDRLLVSESGLRAVGICAGVVLVTAIASFGANTGDTTSEALTPEALATTGPSGGVGAAADPAAGGRAAPAGPGARTVDPSTGVVRPGGGGGVPASQRPDFGLKTQGVTKDIVKVGFSNNFSACGDTAGLATQYAGVIGNPKRAIQAFSRYVNDTGGIGGRKYTPYFAEDGGSGCPERNIPAAVKMADEDKVFLAVPGLDVVSDYTIKRGIPTWGGRDIPSSLEDYGPNGFQLPIPHTPNLAMWASFGKHYLKTDNTDANNACLIRIETGASGNWDIPEEILVREMAKHGLKFRDIVVFKDDASTAQAQANTIAAREKAKGCQQAWFMAGNPVGLVFITQAATQNQWFPKVWTFTSRTAGSDTALFGRLMDQRQWDRAVGLTIRVPPGAHAKDGNCADIYRRYYPNDGASESAAVLVYCPAVLSTAEVMRRGVKLTGTLDANAYVIGANAIRNDFAFDSHVPIEFKLETAKGPFKTRGWSHMTPADWNPSRGDFDFPAYPCYYRIFKARNGGCEDLRPTFK